MGDRHSGAHNFAEMSMSLDPLLLSRLQFVWVIAFHFLLPAFTIG
jgi:cytochrome bd ubiquinol oxidase subunit I